MSARARRALLAALILLAATSSAHGQIAVFDASAFVKLASEVRTLEQQLAQAEASLQAMTGGRGMQLLLSGTVRNYLPPDWATMLRATQGASTPYGALSADTQAELHANAVLSSQELGGLSSAGNEQLLASRQSVALLQSIAHAALANSSSRFSELQQLINAIATATDQKASLDLHARIAAEQGMLQNEQTKLQVLYQSALAQRWAGEQRLREQVIVAHGSFALRFEPVP